MAPTVTTSRSRKARRPVAVIALALLAVAIAIVAVRKPRSDTPDATEAPGGGVPARVQNDVSADAVATDMSEAATTPIQDSLPSKIKLPDSKGAPHALALARTGTVIRAISAGSGISSTNVLSSSPAIFKNEVENFIYRFADSARHPGMIMTRFGDDAEGEVRKILETDIVIYDDDDEDTVAMKERVAALKQDLLKAIEEGYNATDVLAEMREDNNNRVRNRTKMQREFNSLVKSNMLAQADEYLNAANEKLAHDFLPPLVFPEDTPSERR